MKHTNEVQAILTAIFAINRTSEHEDKDITLVLDYAFRRLFGANTNLLILSCIGKTKGQMMPEVMQLLESCTQYKTYLEEYRKRNRSKRRRISTPLTGKWMR